MNECGNIINFTNNYELNELNKLFNCNCKYCNYNYDNYKRYINEIDLSEDKSFENNINLIWTNTMIYIKKYLLIFEKYSNM
tara:strand:- start:6613 stop:6855 length:243 start_codon:yes stop_codon:yes gene_type:complete